MVDMDELPAGLLAEPRATWDFAPSKNHPQWLVNLRRVRGYGTVGSAFATWHYAHAQGGVIGKDSARADRNRVYVSTHPMGMRAGSG